MLCGVTKTELDTAVGVADNGTLVFRAKPPRQYDLPVKFIHDVMHFYCIDCQTHLPYGHFDYTGARDRRSVTRGWLRCLACTQKRTDAAAVTHAKIHSSARRICVDRTGATRYFCSKCGMYKLPKDYNTSRVWTRRLVCFTCHNSVQGKLRKPNRYTHSRKLVRAWRKGGVCIKCCLEYTDRSVSDKNMCPGCRIGLSAIPVEQGNIVVNGMALLISQLSS